MTPSVRSLTLEAKQHIDEVCVAFESAWKGPAPPQIQPYLAGVGEPERSELLRELLLLDLDYRVCRGQSPSREDYRGLFPDDSGVIDEAFQQTDGSVANGMARPEALRRAWEDVRPTQATPIEDSGRATPPVAVETFGQPNGEVGRPAPSADGRCFGDYELLEEVGRGGMGVVYKARQVSLNRIVALKMLLAGRLASREEVERFRREAESAASLQHPNIVGIYEVGEQEGFHYFSMEYVEGKSLADRMREALLPVAEAVGHVAAVAEAIHWAHQQGMLHRDLKPSNVILDRRGRPRITDFGLVRRLEPGSELTATGQVLGSPSYMPPEQATGDACQIGPASDVYALGAMLYELLTGRPPFRAATVPDTLLQVVHHTAVRPRLLNPKIPRDLETICLKCLEKEPQRRYGSAMELADDLGRFLRGEPIRARPVGRLVRLARWCRRRPLVAGLVSAVILTLVAGTAVSTYFAVKAEARAREATQHSWESHLAEARARRFSGRPGRRLDSLEALATAAAIRPTLELRNEAIACMALVDLRVTRELPDGYPLDAKGLAFDAKLQRYAFSDAKGNLTVRTMADNREAMRLPGPGFPAWILRFSPGGRWLAAKCCPTGQNQTNRVWVWDLKDGSTVLKTPHPIHHTALAFSPNDRWLAVGWEQAISLYDLQSGGEARRLPMEGIIGYITFHPDGTRFVATKTDGAALICATADGRKLHAVPGPGHSVWHPAGKLLAVVGADARIHVYDAASWQERAVLEGHAAYLLDFSHGNDLLAGACHDGMLRLWHPMDSAPLLTVWAGPPEPGPTFAPGDRLLAHRIEGSKVSLFEVAHAPECRRLIPEPSSKDRIWHTEISPDGQWLAAACEDGVRVWNLRQAEQVACLPGRQWRAVRFAPEGGSLIASGLSGLSRWPLAREGHNGGATLRIGPPERIALPAGTEAERCSLDHEGGTLAVAAWRDVALLIDPKTHKEKARFGGHSGLTEAVLSPDGRWLACGTWHGSGVKVFDVQQGEVVFSVPDPEANNSHVVFSPDGKWLVVCTGADYRLYAVGTWETRLRIERQMRTDIPGPAAIAPDGRTLAIVPSAMLVRLIDIETGLELATLEAPDVQEFLDTLSFSSDGETLAAGSLSRRLHVWDLRLVRQRLAAMGLDWDLPP